MCHQQRSQPTRLLAMCDTACHQPNNWHKQGLCLCRPLVESCPLLLIVANQVEVANKHNLGSLSYDEAFKQRNIAWASFLRPGVDREQRRYEEVSDWAKVQKLLKDYLDDYNSSHNTSTDLVFFQSAVDHVCRMCRVFQQVG